MDPQTPWDRKPIFYDVQQRRSVYGIDRTNCGSVRAGAPMRIQRSTPPKWSWSAGGPPIKTTIIPGLVDREGGIEYFQHCIVVTQGQEERIPETCTVWELELALCCFPIDLCFMCHRSQLLLVVDFVFDYSIIVFVCFLKTSIAFSMFLGFGGFGRMCNLCGVFVCLWMFICWEIWVSRVRCLFGGTAWKYITTQGLLDRGGGIEDLQHCIVITQGQEERIPGT